MRILFLSPAYVPAWEYGGPVAVVNNMARELAVRGHEVSIWTAAAHASFAPVSETLDGVRISRLSDSQIRRLAFTLPVLGGQLAAALSRYDLVHAHELRTWLNAAILPTANRVGLPVVFTLHGTSNRKRLGVPKAALDKLRFASLLGKADRILALTDDEMKSVKRTFRIDTEMSIFPNGVSKIRSVSKDEERQLRNQFGIRDGVDIVLFLGRIDSTKRVDMLVEAFAAIRTKHAEAELVIAGPNWGALPTLTTLAEQCGVIRSTHFVGPVFGPTKDTLLRAASVFVTPAYIGFPVSLLEAAVAGVPLVTTTLGDELTLLGQAGIVTTPTVMGIGSAISHLLANPEARLLVGERGKDLVERQFLWPILVDRLEAIYRTAVRRGLRRFA